MLRDERKKIPLKSTTTTIVWTRQKESKNQQNIPKSHVCKKERTLGSREIGTVFDSWAAGESDSERVRVRVFVFGAAPITQQTTTKTKRENGSDGEKRERE